MDYTSFKVIINNGLISLCCMVYACCLGYHFLLQRISPPRDRTCVACVTCIGNVGSLPLAPLGKPCLFYTQQFISLNPIPLSAPSSLLSTLVTTLITIPLFSVSVNLFLFCYINFIFEITHISDNVEHLFVFLCLTYFTKQNTFQVHPHHRQQNFFFYG